MQDTIPSRRATPIRYRDPMGAIDWLRAAFLFETRFIATRADGSFAYGHLVLGERQITVTARDERSLEPAEPPDEAKERTMVVADIRAHFARAKAAGAEIVRGLDAGDEGAGGYVCRDVEGHIWSFNGSKAHRSRTALAWARTRLPRVERLAAQRAGLAAAAMLTLVALAVPAWRLYSIEEAQPADVAATPSRKIAEGQALEHARFALAEEQAARLVAEASRRMALAKLEQERGARLHAERDARNLEAELAAARATQAVAEQRVQELDNLKAWETQVAHAVETNEAPAQAPEVVPVSAVKSSATTPDVEQPALPPANPALAEGQAALARGEVEEARRIFRRLADEGMAEAALVLGSTYDPVNAERMHAQGDRAQAKQWYRRAIELAQGATERQREQ